MSLGIFFLLRRRRTPKGHQCRYKWNVVQVSIPKRAVAQPAGPGSHRQGVRPLFWGLVSTDLGTYCKSVRSFFDHFSWNFLKKKKIEPPSCAPPQDTTPATQVETFGQKGMKYGICWIFEFFFLKNYFDIISIVNYRLVSWKPLNLKWSTQVMKKWMKIQGYLNEQMAKANGETGGTKMIFHRKYPALLGRSPFRCWSTDDPVAPRTDQQESFGLLAAKWWKSSRQKPTTTHRASGIVPVCVCVYKTWWKGRDGQPPTVTPPTVPCVSVVSYCTQLAVICGKCWTVSTCLLKLSKCQLSKLSGGSVARSSGGQKGGGGFATGNEETRQFGHRRKRQHDWAQVPVGFNGNRAPNLANASKFIRRKQCGSNRVSSKGGNLDKQIDRRSKSGRKVHQALHI